MTRGEIDPDDLTLALTMTSDTLEYRYFFDSETGAVLLSYPDTDDLPEDLEDNPRYRYIEPIPSWLAFEAMQDFVDSLPEGRPARALQRALAGRKPFRHFKDALLDYPSLREEWFSRQRDFELRQATKWCEEHDIEPIWRRRTGSPAG